MSSSTASRAAIAFVLGLVGCSSSGTSDPAATADPAGKGAPEAPAPTGSTSPVPAAASTTPAAPASTPEASLPAPPGPSPRPLASAPASAKPPTAPAAPAPASVRAPLPTTSAVPTEAPRGPVAGKPWQLVASAVADAGYQCNPDYPNKFTTTGGTNVTYPDPKPRGGCAGNRVAVTIPIVPTAAGPGTVVGTLRYGICDDAKTNCLVRTKDVTLAFTAAP